MYSILKHTDSYLPQKPFWYPLEFKYPTESYQFDPSAFLPLYLKNDDERDDFTATTRESNTPRARAKYIKTSGVFSDEYILQRATSAVNHIFSRKFIDQKQKDSELTVENFVQQQLSRVSFVLSFIPSLEKSLKNDMEREKIPKNRKWLAGCWDRLKKKHGYD